MVYTKVGSKNVLKGVKKSFFQNPFFVVGSRQKLRPIPIVRIRHLATKFNLMVNHSALRYDFGARLFAINSLISEINLSLEEFNDGLVLGKVSDPKISDVADTSTKKDLYPREGFPSSFAARKFNLQLSMAHRHRLYLQNKLDVFDSVIEELSVEELRGALSGEVDGELEITVSSAACLIDLLHGLLVPLLPVIRSINMLRSFPPSGLVEEKK
jgi:hypothetical protein